MRATAVEKQFAGWKPIVEFEMQKVKRQVERMEKRPVGTRQAPQLVLSMASRQWERQKLSGQWWGQWWPEVDEWPLK
jgi:hypothetical protein